MAQAPVVVLDNNVVLSALFFSGGSLAELTMAWQAKRFGPLVCRASEAEPMRVLSYPKIKLQPKFHDAGQRPGAWNTSTLSVIATPAAATAPAPGHRRKTPSRPPRRLVRWRG